jgi:hypothetical protein
MRVLVSQALHGPRIPRKRYKLQGTTSSTLVGLAGIDAWSSFLFLLIGRVLFSTVRTQVFTYVRG